MDDQRIEYLQLHYYLSDNEHSMDAKIFNKVESELLKIVEEVTKILDLEILIEVQALEEGGLKAIYKFLNKKKSRRKIVIVGSFFAGIIATIMSDVISQKINSDPEMERLKKEKLELEIMKLKKELNSDENSKNNEENFVLDQEFINQFSIYVSELNKIKISKSKFYENLLNVGKLDKVSTQELDDNLKPKSQEKFVPRKDFNLFIVKDKDIDPEYQNDVELEIVSPVLKKSRMGWKAIYKGEQITFTLKDENFKNLIINKNLQFSNGTKIICDLEIKQKITDDGEIIHTGKTVYNVTQIIYIDGDIIDII
ncbi:hypothetical protein [Tenacibaculum discolor]|uniref:hypothetical protein n=1 Tax=Tenacibaculum discolor TaxID=361581 RepID=UPI000F5AA9BD|nr:hypothetical protein [Tenacibaculum discolor]